MVSSGDYLGRAIWGAKLHPGFFFGAGSPQFSVSFIGPNTLHQQVANLPESKKGVPLSIYSDITLGFH